MISAPDRARRRQPLLHALVSTTAAPTTVLSGADGQLRDLGVQGVFHADLRVLSTALLLVDGVEPEPIAHGSAGAGGARFVGLLRWLGEPGADPSVRIERIRRAVPGGLTEEITVSSAASVPVSARVTVALAADFAPIEAVKSGEGGQPHPARIEGRSLTWVDGVRVMATGQGATADEGGLHWPVELPARGTVTLRWWLRIDDEHAVVRAPQGPVEWSRPLVIADDRRLIRLVTRSLDDLESLRLTDLDSPQDTFLGAGVPWFLTLFGRDSIWAARMLLPLGTELAAGTLRVLARRQGRRVDAHSGEAPGKIMHELRRHEFTVLAEGLRLPATYYGTVDATLLWISLLHDAWRWGMPDEQVHALLPALRAALGWLANQADPDGFVAYVDTSGHGLANQGWKDSADAVRFHDGRRAAPPITLCEVQGYAYQAALHGAALLDAFDRPGGERWRQYADGLAHRFRAMFWVDGSDAVDGPAGGPYPALALDRDRRRVDVVSSNIGHLLGTGILNAEETRAVARQLATPAMSDGYGLRTMSAAAGGYNPLSYHCGTVWAHDTAIAISGLAETGHADVAAGLIEGLLTAAEAFDYRLPELHAGDSGAAGGPVPYPAACRPQAWSAASAVVILRAMFGLRADVPGRRVRLAPLIGAEGADALGAVAARGLRVGAYPIEVEADRTGQIVLRGLPDTFTVYRSATPIPHPRPALLGDHEVVGDTS